MGGKHWLTGTLNLYGLKLSFQVDKVNTLVKRSIVNIVKRMFSFHSWEGCDFCPCLGYVTIFIPNSPPPPEVHFATSCPRVVNLNLLWRIFWRFLDDAFFIKYLNINSSHSPPPPIFFQILPPILFFLTDFQFSEIFCLSLNFQLLLVYLTKITNIYPTPSFSKISNPSSCSVSGSCSASF